MRFIIHEMPYERPIAAGQLRYERDGRPTGALETWRLTEAIDGYRFLRVDLDAREAPSRRSTLYHLTLNPRGGPEQLKFRYWGDRLVVSGAVVWEKGELLARREVDGVAYEQAVAAAAFWFPSTIGLGLLRDVARGRVLPALTLQADAQSPQNLMALQAVSLQLDDIGPGGELQIEWDGGRRWLRLDEGGYPAHMQRDDGLTAVETRLIVYRRQA